MSDEIIEELWRIKDGIAREHGHDVERLAAGLRSREPAPGRWVVDLRAVREVRERGASAEPRSGDGESVGATAVPSFAVRRLVRGRVAGRGGTRAIPPATLCEVGILSSLQRVASTMHLTDWSRIPRALSATIPGRRRF